MTQVSGRRTALTFTSALRFGGALWLRVFLSLAQWIPPISAPLREFEVIHFARWTVISKLPGRRRWRPRQPLLLFQSNFDTDLLDYIDTFCMIVPLRFKAVWFRAAGYPGLIPPLGFHRWVDELEASPAHYFSAYSQASSPMVDEALRVDREIEAFLQDTANLDDARWNEHFDLMLQRVQGYL